MIKMRPMPTCGIANVRPMPTYIFKLESSLATLVTGHDLRTFALIVSAHPYSARKFTCHFTHRARAQNTKLNNDRADDIVLVKF